MDVNGDIKIYNGNLQSNDILYSCGIEWVQNDVDLLSLYGIEDGDIILTLYDYFFNIYDISSNIWIKFRQLINPKPSNYSLTIGDSGLIHTDEYNVTKKHIAFTLPPAMSGIYYTFIKTISAPNYKFIIKANVNNIISNNLGYHIENNSTSGQLDSITLLCIDSIHWIIINQYGPWKFIGD